jgi:hypothetical protein
MTTQNFYLTGWHPINNSVRALLFGELVKLANIDLERYHSDLWHDAQCVAAITGPTTFFFATDAYGTSIGEDESLVKLRCGKKSHLYMIRLVCDDGSTPGDGLWSVIIDEVEV